MQKFTKSQLYLNLFIKVAFVIGVLTIGTRQVVNSISNSRVHTMQILFCLVWAAITSTSLISIVRDVRKIRQLNRLGKG